VKALVYTAPRKLELQELSVPEVRVGMALVRVRAAGVCGSDLDGFLGRTKRRVPPLVLGHEFSGEIAELGSGVQEFEPGERVAVYPLIPCGCCRYCATGRHNICPERKAYGLDFHGGFSEYVCAPSENLFRMSSGMSFVEGALVEPLANAVHVLDRVPQVEGATALVYGAGSIGVIVLWLAKRLGASRVALVDTSAQRLAKTKALGADLLVNALESNPVEVILEWTGGRGVDFAIDAVGHSVCRSNTVACLAPGGTAVWIGLAGDQTELDGQSVVTGEIEIKGSYAYSRKDFQRSIGILAEKNFPVALLVSEASLEQGQSAFDDLASRTSSLIKAVFTM
jgi:threonine dehydrogenase-like Zn-dependent dehydrogenase